MSFTRCNSLLLALLWLVPAGGRAQQDGAEQNLVSLEAAVAYTYKLDTPKGLSGEYGRDGLSFLVRGAWNAGRRIGLGAETGWMPVSSLRRTGVPVVSGESDLTASLTAVPLLAIVTVDAGPVQGAAGIGYYRLRSEVTLGSTAAESSEWSMGGMLSLGAVVWTDGTVNAVAGASLHAVTDKQLSLVSAFVRFTYAFRSGGE